MKYSCTPNTKERKKCPFEVHYVIQSTKQNTNNQRSAQLIQKKRVQPLVSKKQHSSAQDMLLHIPICSIADISMFKQYQICSSLFR